MTIFRLLADIPIQRSTNIHIYFSANKMTLTLYSLTINRNPTHPKMSTKSKQLKK